jgi:hypothetical protein
VLPPSFARLDDPRLGPAAAPAIRLVGPGSIDVATPLVVSGAFAVSEAEYLQRKGTPHRDLVLSVHREPFYACLHPFRDCLVFADDVLAAGGMRIGWFRLDVWSCCGFRLEGHYYVRVSLGALVSPVCVVAVGRSAQFS